MVHSRLVFPVYAGVIPGNRVVADLVTRVPRVCGGDPEQYNQFFQNALCSPCMRG